MNYAFGGSITVTGTDINFRENLEDAAGKFGYIDIISFSTTGSSAMDDLSGTRQAGDGVSYDF